MTDFVTKKAWVKSQLEFLEEAEDAESLKPYVGQFRTFRDALLKDQNFFNTNRGKLEAASHPELKPYVDFVIDVKFEKGMITEKNFSKNLGNVRTSYRWFLRQK
ncbi:MULTISPECIES: hypothetical protein [Lactobacillus]|uniref:Uncharacterized protein n=1 Tax=Lactobacillus xujianguonis TaxID=2495899 RepID=A0A437SSG5_9LACO|nr:MULTISPECIES: hypothetical protein [Lactobacillus]RVU69863.1 hypothetical protein EJK17_10830 [Lactobacillus xujianguonis]RVU71927.1 hypothetical protein EJK20_11200 [Lactobacillus xujianguonis]